MYVRCHLGVRIMKMQMPVDKHLLFLLHLYGDIYERPLVKAPSLLDVDIDRLLILASDNNLLFYTVKTMLGSFRNQLTFNTTQLLVRISDRGDKRFEQLKDTIKTLNAVLDEYVLFKTCRAYPRIPTDIDIIVPDYGEAVNKLVRMGMVCVERFESTKEAMVLDSKNMMKIHVHTKVGWHNARYFDDNILWNNQTSANFLGEQVTVPSSDIDLLIHLAHINFETLHIRLSDLVHFYALNEPDILHEGLLQARKHSWEQSFTRSITIFNDIHTSLLFSEKMIDFEHLNDRNIFPIPSLSFPFSLPRLHIIGSFLEKRLFNAFINSFSKSLRVLVTGETYKSYYISPEQKILSESLKDYSKQFLRDA